MRREGCATKLITGGAEFPVLPLTVCRLPAVAQAAHDENHANLPKVTGEAISSAAPNLFIGSAREVGQRSRAPRTVQRSSGSSKEKHNNHHHILIIFLLLHIIIAITITIITVIISIILITIIIINTIISSSSSSSNTCPQKTDAVKQSILRSTRDTLVGTLHMPNLVSLPVLMTTPMTHEVFRRWQVCSSVFWMSRDSCSAGRDEPLPAAPATSSELRSTMPPPPAPTSRTTSLSTLMPFNPFP